MSSNSARPRAGVDSEKQSFSTGDSKVPPGPPKYELPKREFLFWSSVL